MPDPIELGATAYSLHPDQRRRRARRGMFAPRHPFTRHDDREPEPAGAPPAGAMRRLLAAVASGWLRMVRAG